ncbi:MFS transporter [Neobacillus mesonae]|uniref:Putative proline/betaine transporter n=1 Tax=Neobacillus mesonae TaxID=1193713 RepID=A0A3T0I0M3_9BACI|nr:MFS transporter [Neobacillus mesonae]AZU62808.1 MFS transporter [Neobacillus mesonae]
MSANVQTKKVRKKALVASLIGSSIEYYDYLLYGTVAALVFNKLFFPNFDPTVGLLISLASFGIPYFFRPLGGVIFSHIGDKIGRKKSLVYTLAIMGISTALIGFLPVYETIGIWAPILLVLLRLIQGIAVGGEWGGAVLLAVEYSDKKKRGFAGSVPMMGAAVGMILATATMALLRLLPDAQFLAWGWRVPFIGSLVLVFLGLWIRNGLEETPDFQQAKEEGAVSKLPIVDTFKYHWKEIILTTGAKAIETAPFYIFATFGISYATNTLKMPEGPVLNAITIGTLISLVMIPLMGRLSDHVGRKKVFVSGTLGVILFSMPYFYLLSKKSILLLTIAVMIGYALWSVITAVLGTMFSEMFRAEVRYTGISVGYQLGAAIFGGTAPLIATSLVAAFHGSWVPAAIYLMLLGVMSLICVSLIKGMSEEEKEGMKKRINTAS